MRCKAQRKHREKNGDELNRRQRLYYLEHKTQAAAKAKNRLHLKRSSGGNGVTNMQWDDILKKYNFRCAYCGIQGNMTVDHVTPLSKGGEHSLSNVVPACPECNDRKGVRLDWKPRILRRLTNRPLL